MRLPALLARDLRPNLRRDLIRRPGCADHARRDPDPAPHLRPSLKLAPIPPRLALTPLGPLVCAPGGVRHADHTRQDDAQRAYAQRAYVTGTGPARPRLGLKLDRCA